MRTSLVPACAVRARPALRRSLSRIADRGETQPCARSLQAPRVNEAIHIDRRHVELLGHVPHIGPCGGINWTHNRPPKRTHAGLLIVYANPPANANVNAVSRHKVPPDCGPATAKRSRQRL